MFAELKEYGQKYMNQELEDLKQRIRWVLNRAINR